MLRSIFHQLTGRLTRRPSPARKTLAARPRPLALEQFEPRLVLNASSFIQNRTLEILCDSFSPTTVKLDNGFNGGPTTGTPFVQVTRVIASGFERDFADSAFDNILLFGGFKGQLEVDVAALVHPLTVHGDSASDTVNLGTGTGGIDNVEETVSVDSFFGKNAMTLTITDEEGTSLAASVNLDTLHTQGGPDQGEITFFEANFPPLNGQQRAHVLYNSIDTASVNLFLNSQTTTINVFSTVTTTNIWASSPVVVDTINVGNNTDGLGDIKGDLNLLNLPWYNQIHLNDSADTVSRTGTASIVSPPSSLGVAGDFGQLTGMGNAGAIRWHLADTAGVSLATNGHSTVSDPDGLVNVQ
jgi:hypothetical protein